ncbi:MAG: DNA-directed RNA polymerase subunit beta' [Bacillota bacterium]
MFELNDFNAIQISVASSDTIREWSYGEVTKPETINYRTQKPEKEGLFCEKIFGPIKDWECSCGKYKRIRYKGTVCDKCGVEVTRSKVRRERMGHIELAAPVSHIWYFKGVPSRMGLLLDMSPKLLEQVLYFVSYVVLDAGDTDLAFKQVISEKEYREKLEEFGSTFKVSMGAEAVKELLMGVDLDKESAMVSTILEKATGQKRVRAVKRLEIIESLRRSKIKPELMIMDVLPVLPPDLRPMVQLDGGRFATSDLNDLYRRVINRNNRLKKLMEIGAPEIIVRNEKRMLQEAVDALIDNGRRGKAVSGPGNRELKSLSSMLKGKQGRFRQNLLGKRVDYSGRSVIVVGPELKLHQCGLPKEMALELFKPFIMHQLVERGIAGNVRNARKKVENQDREVWDILEDVIREHPVLLNRAPTLHRLSIQAFEPVLIEGRAIKIHPLVCSAFNADFDGDQMAVHVPLSLEAQAEARFLMLASNNIMKLSNGSPVAVPTQDMIVGSYYLTMFKRDAKGEGRYFKDFDEAFMAYQLKEIELQSKVYIRVSREIDGEIVTKRLYTTVGRMIFNKAIPQDIGMQEVFKSDIVDPNPKEWTEKENKLNLAVDTLVKKGQLTTIVDECFKRVGATRTAEVLDMIKSQGFKYSTIGAITTSLFDMHIPQTKYEYIAKSEEEVLQVERKFKRGLISEEERYKGVIAAWQKAEKGVTEALKDVLDAENPIWMMADSGARGSMHQIRQLSGMRGLMTDPSGKTIEVPVKASFREGLTVLEYFISSHGGRKGLADTALKTADSGYLTRRLVDVAHEVIIREDDCFETAGEKVKGMMITAIVGEKASAGDEEQIIEKLSERINGRVAVSDVIHPQTGEVLAVANEMITEAQSIAIEKAGIKGVECRTLLTCRSKSGVCAKCYGKNMANGKLVHTGEAVGVIAAQSIGEPGTQLTMRTFHTGGVAGADDITQGLPRIEEIFEARKPKGMAVLSEYAGTVSIKNDNKSKKVVITQADGVEKEYPIQYGVDIKVKDGDAVVPGSVMTGGSINLHEILKTTGVRGVQDYILTEVQKVYRMQSVSIADKHVEIIIRQMLRKVKVEDVGDTDILPGDLMDLFKYEEENEKAIARGGRPAVAKRVLLGVTKASLATESFLSAASFQETARVLTESAIKNKIDPLVGLKENVIIGKLIPAGTGIKKYKNISTAVVQRTDINLGDYDDDDEFDLIEEVESVAPTADAVVGE